jgi:hypothetical protein
MLAYDASSCSCPRLHLTLPHNPKHTKQHTQVFVKTLTGKTITLDYRPHTSVACAHITNDNEGPLFALWFRAVYIPKLYCKPQVEQSGIDVGACAACAATTFSAVGHSEAGARSPSSQTPLIGAYEDPMFAAVPSGYICASRCIWCADGAPGTPL